MSRTASSQEIQKIIEQLSKDREKQLGEIRGLFSQFGVAARQDIVEQVTQAQGRAEQDLISRGLSQTTIRPGVLGQISRQGQREERRVGEQVAGLEAGFLERQLVDPGLITQLISQASAVDTSRINVGVGATTAQTSRPISPPNFIRPTTSTGGGGASPGGVSFGLRGGGGGQTGARVVRAGRFAQATGQPTQASTQATTGAVRQVAKPEPTPVGGTGTVTSSATGAGVGITTPGGEVQSIGGAAQGQLTNIQKRRLAINERAKQRSGLGGLAPISRGTFRFA